MHARRTSGTRHAVRIGAVALLSCLLATSSARAQGCTPGWLPLAGGTNGEVYALTVYDDGQGGGPALFAGGSFTKAGGAIAKYVAKWDGASWSPVGGGLSGTVHALTVFDDGSGPRLVAGGTFGGLAGQIGKKIAIWDGTSWSGIAGGISTGFGVFALTSFDDGSGPALFVGGSFSAAGGTPAKQVAKWDGTSWSALGSGLNNSVEALTVFDDGSGGGPSLYAGGFFNDPGPGTYISRWDGTNWVPVGGGMSNSVIALEVFDDGNGGGPALYAGGGFTKSGGVTTKYVARWDGAAWSSLAGGLDGPVYALAAFDDGSGGGPALHAAGNFTFAGPVATNDIAKWDGAQWTPLGSGVNAFSRALAVFDDGFGGAPALCVGGQLTAAGGVGASRVARWRCPESAAWSDLGYGLAGAAGVPVLAGTGSRLAWSPATLTLSGAAPGSLAFLFIAYAATPTPFKGGMLVPLPVALTVDLATDFVGSIPLAWPAWPAAVPPGFPMYFQYAIQDAAAPAGVALSNGVQSMAP